ncbi:probable Ferric-uptake regulator [Alteracholeplasma palmae J233]|uniref:Probable Ferric-uptake regulator n=1 Tax=Alteracholeplasma palmae (strain ATCC 49389 / J233) TaxID=1318466 RepID=U4KQF9_ALTPJ|nr:transcriptional repressor [Alteracholeplasma palmae]CCV64560.1 probable Ferric-uptake regulator [Alteracholeplasma palmae J233]
MDNHYTNYLSHLDKDAFRLTKARKALLDVLENNHLRFKDIHDRLVEKGFDNISTLYNNLDFFVQNKVIMELNIDGEIYYDIAQNNPHHNISSHIHIVTKDLTNETQEISEIQNPEIFNLVKDHPLFKNSNVEYIQMIVSVIKK